jgi:hypothetical protein
MGGRVAGRVGRCAVFGRGHVDEEDGLVGNGLDRAFQGVSTVAESSPIGVRGFLGGVSSEGVDDLGSGP